MTIVRQAEPNDLPQVMTFHLLPGDRVTEIVERRMLVAEQNGTILGYISWQMRGCIGLDYVNRLVVKPMHRRQGIGKNIMTSMSIALTGRVFISTKASNQSAIALIESTDWTKAGELYGLLPDNEAEVFFWRDLR
ncbi:GNAT family N-acetyltransferase [Sphingomonas oligophenolica]|uniref:N-acetyltransferase n=1 Tax=Sphingomonas oligophenolica TaxID=301154 RepID=A0A502CPJ4_9SPHN|nr:GNAT family N-acetyltransferase [Sphingomonas oligophenolica]TPG13631.1 N-acetyltransferase [Sphingomonas oligophenolica]